jgi:DNA-binding GntR family transcriptional regulator
MTTPDTREKTLLAIPPRNKPPRTRTETLRLQLADEIVTGVLEPGTPLDEQELARRFGVSRTPVREAIRQLAASGLVDTRPHRGAVVALPTPRELDEMFRAMAELEALCAGLCAIHMTPSERAALQAMHQEMGALMQAGEVEPYYAANIAFHTAIYEGAANGYLAGIAQATRTRVAPFRHAQFRASGRLARSHAEHAAVLQAILRGDRVRATDAMRAHIDTVRDVYRTVSREA